MNIEIVDHEMPFTDHWLGFHRALNMVQVVLFSPGRASRDAPHLAGGNLKVDDKSQGAVSNILVFPSFHLKDVQRDGLKSA